MTTDELQIMLRIYNESKNRILLYLEAVVHPDQFRALRKLILDELGRSGAEGRITKLLGDGKGREDTSKKGG